MVTKSQKWWYAYSRAEYQIAPQIAAWRANRKIRRRADVKAEEKSSFEGLELDGVKQQELLQVLKENHKAELDRRNRIVEKGKAALFIIGVTIPLMISVLTATKTTGFSIVEVVLLGLGVLSLVLSAVCATEAVNIKAVYGLHLDDMFGMEGTRVFMHADLQRIS